MSKKYINTAIPYVNAKPHIGTVLDFLYGDVCARYFRQRGNDVRFHIGLDEHGQKNAKVAQERGMTPQEHVDELAHTFLAVHEAMDISYDTCVRTTDPKHAKVAQSVWRRVMDAGDLEKRQYEGLYCVGCEAFKTEKDLVNGKCPDHDRAPEPVQEENYFFLLSRYEDRLLELYASRDNFVVPTSRFNEMKEIVRGGLEDISVSRAKEQLSWGVPVPDDDTQVMYVWFEAVLNYLTGAGYGTDEFDDWWPSTVNIVGKDINRFHAIILPAILMSAGIAVPQQIAAHGFITAEGKKMSKSLGNVLDPIELVNQYGMDPIRYFLMREIPFDRDGDFSDARFCEVYQSELANGIGNLLSRVTNMVDKYFDGDLQARPFDGDISAYASAMESFQFHEAIAFVSRVVSDANEMIEQKKPWELAKTDEAQLKEVLEVLLGYLVSAGEMLLPFMPKTAQIVIDAVTAKKIIKTQPLFPRLEKKL